MAQQVKNLPAIQETQETQVQSLGQEDPLEREMATHPVFLPEKSHGQRSLVGYSQRSQRVGHSQVTKHMHKSYMHILFKFNNKFLKTYLLTVCSFYPF